jgi:hypothetical protein
MGKPPCSIWPSSSSITPFYGQLSPDQIYSPEDPVLTGAPLASKNQAGSTSPKNNDGDDADSS